MVSNEDDVTLVEQVKASAGQDSPALNEIIARHSGVYQKIVTSYFPKGKWEDGCISLDEDFIRGSAGITIYNAALEFDPAKNVKFSSFVGHKTKYFCLRYIDQFLNPPISGEEITLEDDPVLKPFPEGLGARDSLSEIFKIAGEMQDGRAIEILKERYLSSPNGKTVPWKKINKKIFKKNGSENVTPYRCLQIHNKAIEEIKSILKKEISL